MFLLFRLVPVAFSRLAAEIVKSTIDRSSAIRALLRSLW